MKDSGKASFDEGPLKTIKISGFKVSVKKTIKKALVLQYRSEKVPKRQRFYSIGPKRY